jgi:soluble lytic murein transglycosylase
MTIQEAIEILEENGYCILSEDIKSTLGKAIGIGALAASTAFGNSHIDAKPVNDTTFGKNSIVHVHDRYNLDSDRYGVPKTYKLSNNKSPYTISKKDEIELTKKKILATPKSMLKKSAKENLDAIAKCMVETANKYNVDIDILLAIAGTESNFNNDSKSGKGAVGIMQITKNTAYDSHFRLQKKDKNTFDFNKLRDMETNIDNAGRIIANLSKRHNNIIEMMLAAYNGGRRQSTAWRAYKANRTLDKDGNEAPKLATETKNYIDKCMMLYKIYKDVQRNEKA